MNHKLLTSFRRDKNMPHLIKTKVSHKIVLNNKVDWKLQGFLDLNNQKTH
jgi:hypothetical protein